MICPYCFKNFDTIKETKTHCREFYEKANYDDTKIIQDIIKENKEFLDRINTNEKQTSV